jgi:RNA polymerase sigma factor (sigma-70 family)
VDDSLEAWFQREILPCEAALVRFLSRKWARREDVQDIRHDIYIRVLESAEQSRPSQPRAFLFSVARNILIDRARRDRIVSIDLLEDLDALNVLIDNVSPERQASGRQQLQRLSKLFDRMPLRCREVVWMRRVEGLTQKEVAQRLGIADATVEKHLFRGLRLLADALYGGAHDGEAATDDEGAIETGHEHGK